MARTNTVTQRTPKTTHEGARAGHVSAETQLRRSVLSCMLFEDTFYEDGQSIAERIHENAKQCSPQFVADLAKEARESFRLRHAPLWLAQSLIGRSGGGAATAKALAAVIKRPDEIPEMLAMYWKDGKKPIPRAMKRAWEIAFNSFDEYQLAKWNNKKKDIRLKDCLFLAHAKPKNGHQAELFRRLANDELATPDTRETRLSSGESAKSTYLDLLTRNKLGYMALLKNLKTISDSGVPPDLVRKRLAEGAARSKALPFRFLTAAKHAPMFDAELGDAMLAAFADLPKLRGTTSVLVDCSGSMSNPVSEKSEVRMLDAAAALAVYAREASSECRVFAFGTDCVEVANRRGMPLADAVLAVNGYDRHSFGNAYSLYHANKGVGHGTEIGKATSYALRAMGKHDRMIVITDMQSRDRLSASLTKSVGNVYMLNVSPYQNGIGHEGQITHISGFSEQVMRYISEAEDMDLALLRK